ncbi:MAG: methyltransferase domain-containing protein, partial [Candidatus Latescibacteria bacterium]|nr:methyltransferase domain-containing protein [Candidatus Latescibacterota bacterium]
MVSSEPTGEKVGFLARCPRGLEWVSAGEIKGRLDATIVAVKHREILFELPTLDPDVLFLNTIDDVFLNCGFIDGIDHTRASLQVLSEAVKKFDFADVLTQVRKVRRIRHSDRFDVVCSFLGRRNYNRYEVEEAVGSIVTQQLGTVQQSHRQRTDSDVSWRVHIRDNEAYIGLRVSAKPLHRREYKVASKAGTPHPPIASALALLSGIRTEGTLLDPFCGSGTIPIEASRFEPELAIFASDIDPSSVELARINAGHTNTKMSFAVADAGQLPFAYRAFDRLVCNLPWGQTVKQKGCLRSNTIAFWRELSRTLHSEGRAVILSGVAEPIDDRLAKAGLILVLRQEIRVLGRWSNLSIVVSESNRNPTPIDVYGRLGSELADSLVRYPTMMQCRSG